MPKNTRTWVGYQFTTLVDVIHVFSFSGHFLMANYKQALESIQEMPLRIETLTSGRQISDAQFASWLEAERTYLISRQTEPETDVLGIEYVEMLNKYYEAR